MLGDAEAKGVVATTQQESLAVGRKGGTPLNVASFPVWWTSSLESYIYLDLCPVITCHSIPGIAFSKWQNHLFIGIA